MKLMKWAENNPVVSAYGMWTGDAGRRTLCYPRHNTNLNNNDDDVDNDNFHSSMAVIETRMNSSMPNRHSGEDTE